ncbi:roadblock/LC7 domain-containing protein [Phytohabitans flavus]|uniref:roadblock/LC7 domain-containing protein n=1 Tax=Phytohabitans flavus TaxID=1076124 RepID=UPI003642533E
MAHPAVISSDLAWLLDDVADRVPGAEHAVAISPDGLLLAASRHAGPIAADQLSTVAAGLYALAVAAGRHTDSGGVRQVTIEMREKFLFVTATAGGAILAVVFESDADVDVIAYEMALFAGRADHHLPAFTALAAS